MGLSEFQKARVENIERNRALLRQLELEGLSESISKEAGDEHITKRPRSLRARSKAAPVKREPIEPTRRSRRIMGIKVENNEEFTKLREEEERVAQRKQQLEKLRLTRLIGDFLLSDLVTDKKLGSLKYEDRVIKLPEELQREEDETLKVKSEDDNANSTASEKEEEVLAVLQLLGDKFSAGDFYETLRNQKSEDSNKDLQKKREEFDKLHVFERYDPLAIKITHARITAMSFHPSTTDRLVLAGDTVGHIGMWSVDNTTNSEEPTISILKPHGKAVSRILVHDKTKVLSSSYDGSVRQMDLNKLSSSEIAHLSDPFYENETIGVSDINICKEGNTLYMTSLSGSFYKHDLREPFKSPNKKNLLRLHDKKIGSFSINPNASYQIATASLDRTLRVWDLRKCNGKNSWWSDYEHQISPHCYGSYGSSLSVSCVDWSAENRLVCNGYDNYILLFNFSGSEPNYPLVTTWANDFQPNLDSKRKKTPKKESDEERETLPENLLPFTKIRHNCQTGRWVSILKSKWQTHPADGVQKFVIANMNRGLDIYDQKGQILGHLTDSELVGAVPAVATLHPTQNWVVGGSASGKVYFFE